MMLKRFREVCQRKLEELPDFPCQNALNALHRKEDQEFHCPWYINNKISCYCWFKYCKLITKEHGKIYEHTFEEIAQMDNCTATYIKNIESKAFQTLQKKISNKNPQLKKFILSQFKKSTE